MKYSKTSEMNQMNILFNFTDKFQSSHKKSQYLSTLAINRNVAADIYNHNRVIFFSDDRFAN